MSLNFRAAGPSVAANNPNSITLTLPTGVVANDLLLAVIYCKQRATTVSFPAGWATVQHSAHSIGLSGLINVFAMRYSAGDPTTAAFPMPDGTSGSTVLGQIFAFSGSSLGSGFVLGSKVASLNTSAINIGPIASETMVKSAGMALLIAARADDFTSAAVPTGDGCIWSQLGAINSTLGSDAGLVVFNATWSSAPPTMTARTIVLTGGGAEAGMGLYLELIPAIIAQPVVLTSGSASTVGTGKVVKIKGTGVLVSQGASTAGVAKRVITRSSSALQAQQAATAGTGKSARSGTGVLLAQRATTSGASGTLQIIYATGTPPALIAGTSSTHSTIIIEDLGTQAHLFAQNATIGVSTAKVISAISASLRAGTSTMLGTGQDGKKGTGVLVAQSASSSGSSGRTIVSISAALAAQRATTVGVAKRVIPGSGILLAATGASLTTVETIVRKGTGVLIAGSPTMTAVGGPHQLNEEKGAGNLLAGAATITSSASLTRNISATLLAGSASLSATTHREIILDADLEAQNATMTGQVIFGDIATWESDNVPWGQPSLVHSRDWPIFTVGHSFFQADITNKFDKSPVLAIVERQGLTIFGRDRQGNWKSDPLTVKFVKGIWPLFRGTPGSIVHIYVGGQMSTEEPVDWEGPYDFTIGFDNFIDFTVSGRYIALRFESTGQEPWDLTSYDLDIEVVGEF